MVGLGRMGGWAVLSAAGWLALAPAAAQAETLAERIHNYRRMIKTPKKQVVAQVNNQIAVFLMTLCGERNDEAVNACAF